MYVGSSFAIETAR